MDALPIVAHDPPSFQLRVGRHVLLPQGRQGWKRLITGTRAHQVKAIWFAAAWIRTHRGDPNQDDLADIGCPKSRIATPHQAVEEAGG